MYTAFYFDCIELPLHTAYQKPRMKGSPVSATQNMVYFELLEKGKRFCAYRDRCKAEVAQKLLPLGATGQLLEKVINALIEEGFIDEKRFSEAFARGKFEYNQWGRLRIKQELILKKIPEELIDPALNQIDQNQYQLLLEKIATKKLQSLKGRDEFTARGKTAGFCINKGFEPDLVWKTVNKINFK